MPYLNVTARWDGAPDQGLLMEKGGRGFPYSTIMNADAEVLWEVRPTSKEAVAEGLASAKLLQSLKERAAENPDDAGLAASIELLSAMGMQQREAPPIEELEKLGATEGLVPEVKERFDSWMQEKRFAAKLDEAARGAESEDDFSKAVFALYREGLRPPEGSDSALRFWFFATKGAVLAKDAAAAKELVAKVEGFLEEYPTLEEAVQDLKKQIDELG